MKPFEGLLWPMLAGAAALFATLLLTPVARLLAFKYGAIDDPKRDERRIHKEPIPRWGGMAIYAGVLISLLVIIPLAQPTGFPPYLIAILVIGAIIVFLGSLDDLKQYSAKIQMGYLLLAGVAVQFFSDKYGQVQVQGFNWPLFTDNPHWISFGIWAVPLTAIYIFVVTKTMDTIDGVDGLAGGIAAIAATTLMIIAGLQGQPRVALVAGAAAGACFGFLPYNYNPAKIFMATGGSQFLGFLLACLSIVGALKTAAALAILIPLLVFGVPIFDAAFAVTRRLLSGNPITQADKRHVHHTLLGKGLTQKQTVWVLYIVASLLCGLLIYLAVGRGEPPAKI